MEALKNNTLERAIKIIKGLTEITPGEDLTCPFCGGEMCSFMAGFIDKPKGVVLLEEAREFYLKGIIYLTPENKWL